MAKVTCVYCKCEFDRTKEPFVQVSERRYAHASCHEKAEASKPQDVKDYEALERYIKQLFNTSVLSAKVRKQIKDYKETYNYTYTGMLKTLQWWYDVQKNSIEKANGGIGIVPYKYDEACKYYYSLYLAQMAAAELAQSDFDFTVKVREIEIDLPKVWTPPPRLFNLGEDD